MNILLTQTIFFGVVVSRNNFFAPASFCKQFFCPSYCCGFHYKFIYRVSQKNVRCLISCKIKTIIGITLKYILLYSGKANLDFDIEP